MIVRDLLARLGIAESNPGACGREWIETAGPEILSHNPDNWSVLGGVRSASTADYDRVIAESVETFERWRRTPAPVRGEIVHEIGDELRARKADLGALVTLETGKILAEGEGEVQEMIDISVFAAGLSRQLYGKTMHSERAGHRMYEQWHPLGPVGVITAFNFPVAVWSWNALIAAVCGDTVVWKPSPRTPLTGLAVEQIANGVAARHGFAGVFSLVIGSNEEIGEAMLRDRSLALISFTGSSAVGRHVAAIVGERLGRTLLELGGNNGLIVMNDADPDLALRAVLFGAVGT
ncbi:MAG TPA: aldehyde dehydrogenase family protein, partial [Bryobacteraceae bacterium]|nr:aldehyde dehydrogenase family protein [Bryobacteraceae bacterium]